jgi:4-oxalocrotonate tautomerase
MPIVRIDLIEGKSEEYRVQVGEIVYQTLVDVLNVPEGDRFQVITERRKSVTDRLHRGVKLRKEDVFINLVEVPKENWSYGNGLAQYVSH